MHTETPRHEDKSAGMQIQATEAENSQHPITSVNVTLTCKTPVLLYASSITHTTAESAFAFYTHTNIETKLKTKWDRRRRAQRFRDEGKGTHLFNTYHCLKPLFTFCLWLLLSPSFTLIYVCFVSLAPLPFCNMLVNHREGGTRGCCVKKLFFYRLFTIKSFQTQQLCGSFHEWSMPTHRKHQTP